MTTIKINFDPGELPKLSEKAARALAVALQAQAECLLKEAFAATPRTPPPRPSSDYWRPHDAAWSRPLHPNCRSVVVRVETDYIETEYTVGEGRLT